MILKAACTCHHGRVRENNEDNLYFNGEILPLIHRDVNETMTLGQDMNKKLCFGVFDGMGGEQNGEEASYLAARVCTEKQADFDGNEDSGEKLCEIIFEANKRICERTREKKLRRMGSTAAMLLFDKDKVWICNIGDSRIYRMRGNELIQCSVEHTDRALVERQGGRRKPYLTQHLGIFPDEMRIEPYCVSREVRAGDIYLICSDGLTDMLCDEEIRAVLIREISAKKKAEELCDAALKHGGRDNITVQTVQIEEGELKKENKFRRIFFRRK